ncbi:MAG TPA: DNA topoisomerase IB [Vicinamibacterales bacterium]|nr:DNA topoisomerase IB [Vicinamibacterales bacterium]
MKPLGDRGQLTTAVSSRTITDASIESARAAGLRYTTDARPGIRRLRRGRTFHYVGPDGRRVTAAEELARIRALVIPPAWEEVWICPDPRGHLQATGRDARGRKQYRYHPKWRQVRDETKYDRMIGFAQALPKIRERTARDMARAGMPREKVLATVVQLLEKTLIRVGNDEYAKQNRSFGLTTLRDGHVDVRGGTVRFTFRGKSGIEHEIDLEDRRLARIVKSCRDIPGYDLFQYYDDTGERCSIGSADVNEYLKEITGEDYTSKDFRTWAGTVLAAQMLREIGAFTSQAQSKRNIVQAVESVAKKLGNTKAVCRKCYIHPAIFDAYVDGSMTRTVLQRARKAARNDLSAAEASVLALLQRRLSRQQRKKAS